MLILFNFLFMWLYLFPFLSQDGEERYRIVNLYENVQTIMIDNSEKKVNDTFSERPHIVWGQNKAMRVRDIKTGRIYLVTAKTLDVFSKPIEEVVTVQTVEKPKGLSALDKLKAKRISK